MNCYCIYHTNESLLPACKISTTANVAASKRVLATTATYPASEGYVVFQVGRYAAVEE